MFGKKVNIYLNRAMVFPNAIVFLYQKLTIMPLIPCKYNYCTLWTKLPRRCSTVLSSKECIRPIQPSYRYVSKSVQKCTRYGGNLNKSTSFIRNKSTLYYVISIVILAVGLSYAAVPMYRIFCQAYSYGGTPKDREIAASKVESMTAKREKEITIRFNADLAAAMTWNFRPQQRELKVCPGETALAFYIAKNPTDKAVIGVSTYNVLPFEAGQYFNKIQCFCFEEQMLNPKEEVSMPVFFYIDPEFDDDPSMENVDTITLSYTFFEVKEGLNIPLPGFLKK